MAVSEKNCSEDYLQKGFPKIASQCKVSFTVFVLQECHFRRRTETEEKKVSNYIRGSHLGMG